MADLSRMAVSASGEDMLRQQLFQLSSLTPPGEALSVEAVKEAAPSQEQEQEAPLSEDETEQIEGAIEQLDELLKPLSIGLNVQRVETLNRFYVELLDRETGEVIREIPSRKIIELQENVRAMQGLLFDKFS